MNTLQITPLAALVAAALLTGCGERRDADSTATTTSPLATTSTSPGTAGASGTGSAGSTTSPPMASGSPVQNETTNATGTTSPSTTAGGTAPSGSIDGAGPALAMVDRNFVTTAAAAGMFEVEAGKLAAEKAIDPAVKAFGKMLVEHRSKANDELRALASTKNVTLPSELPSDKKVELDKLRSTSGSAFDRRFVQEIGIEDHQDDIRQFEKASRDAKDPQVKSWAAKTLPTLRDHYAKAQTLPGGGEKGQTTGRGSTSDGSETRGGMAAGGTGSDAGNTATTAAGTGNSATPAPPPSR